MSSSLQTLIALGLVALALTFLVRHWLKQRRNPGCGDSCSAVSSEVRRLRTRLKR
ncbi:MAG: FeoB-associated Cys-rich membrane protein [Opitutaceae bacterium]|nr:FeoB-associated Cys-rich membrane protein [Opitutaceae bacterium]